MSQSILKNILIGVAAGLLAKLVSLLPAYVVGVIVTLVAVDELAATALTALTVLPIMLLFVLLNFVFIFGVLELAPTQFDGSEGRLCDGVRDPMEFHSPNMLEDGYDIRTIQELLGHKDVAMTMIYTHVLNRGDKSIRSPADAL